MKNKKKYNFRKIIVILGVLFLVTAMCVLLVWQGGIYLSKAQAEKYVEIIKRTTPESTGGVPAVRRDNTMSTLYVDGNDFIGVLEMPKYGCILPVGGEWGKVSKFPCRFDGNIYERNMQIGATTQKGQYEFFREITVGDSLLFTDMEGNLYTYSVSDIRYTNNADRAYLESEEADLTLFLKNIYAFEYIVVFCEVLD